MAVRAVALAAGVLGLVGAGIALVVGQAGAALGISVWSALLLAGVVFERWRYKPTLAVAGAGFQPTAERFIDTDTGRPVQVFVEPATGERRYVEG